MRRTTNLMNFSISIIYTMLTLSKSNAYYSVCFNTIDKGFRARTDNNEIDIYSSRISDFTLFGGTAVNINYQELIDDIKNNCTDTTIWKQASTFQCPDISIDKTDIKEYCKIPKQDYFVIGYRHTNKNGLTDGYRCVTTLLKNFCNNIIFNEVKTNWQALSVILTAMVACMCVCMCACIVMARVKYLQENDNRAYRNIDDENQEELPYDCENGQEGGYNG